MGYSFGTREGWTTPPWHLNSPYARALVGGGGSMILAPSLGDWLAGGTQHLNPISTFDITNPNPNP